MFHVPRGAVRPPWSPRSGAGPARSGGRGARRGFPDPARDGTALFRLRLVPVAAAAAMAAAAPKWAQPGVGWPPLNGQEDAPGEGAGPSSSAAGSVPARFTSGVPIRSITLASARPCGSAVVSGIRIGPNGAARSEARKSTHPPGGPTLSSTRLRLRASRQRSGRSASVPSLGVLIRSMEPSSGVFAPKEMGWEVPPPGGRLPCAGAPPEASVSGRPSQPTARRAAISCVSWGATEKRSPTTP